MPIRGPVSVLRQRLEFMEGIAEVAKYCNWTEVQIQELRKYIHYELVEIENGSFHINELTGEKELALVFWERKMEELRHWLSLSLGIKIKYI